MQKLFLTSAFVVCALLLAACGNNPPAPASRGNTNAAANSAAQGGGSTGANTSGVGVVSSHGGGNPAPASDSASERSLADTAELDARIKKAAEKAKAPGASAADKKAAADAYLARANVYWSAGQPRLYKYALADFRQVLRYDPDNDEARQKIDTIVGIYQSMGRPVPEVSPEP
jgi:tetratricopeptide (TPR) repeat protein